MPPSPTRQAFFLALQRLWQRHGVRFVFVGVHRSLWFLARRLLGPRHFAIGGERSKYFLHPFVIDTERCVEIPLAQDFLAGQDAGSVLEVGNVLSTYVSVEHRVLDLYEQAPGVSNEDAATFEWQQRFARIVCLSTLEHVGRDEPEVDLAKAERALTNLRRHLEPGGQLLVTIPLGYHERLDEALATNQLGETSCHYLRRDSRWNVWTEIDGETAAGARFGAPFPCGNVVAVLRFGPPAKGSL